MMTVEMIPDPPGREIAFEPQLDDLLPIFCPDWELPPIMAGEHQHHRCEVKRYQIGQAAQADLEATRRYSGQLLHAAMYDQCRSGIGQLMRPLVDAIGYRELQTRIVGYMQTGAGAEKIGATMAWYWARPGLKYASRDDLKNGTPTQESRAAQEALSDLRDTYRTACLEAFLASDDLTAQQALSLWIERDPAAYPADLQASHELAWQIITADPEHFRSRLQR
jgi:hypothetical protein